MLYIAQYRILIPFVTAFIFAYTLGYSHFVQAFSAPTMHYYLLSDDSKVSGDALPYQHLLVEEITTVDLTDYTTFPDPKGEGSYAAYKDLFEFVSVTTGVDLKLLATIAASESSFDSKATPGGTNTAKGLFQFTDDTWSDAVKKYGSDYGVTLETSPFDPKANTIMAAMHLKDSSNRIFGKDAKPVDTYLVHFLGPTGAKKFMKAAPHKVAAKYMPNAAKRNRNIFFKGKKPKTYKEVYLTLNSRLQEKSLEFNIN
ncbi:MAG: transglycosylase SLT domain-containing protein [Candidatus Dojkabacteria bacterium]